MKIITPNYYVNFKCIADQCRHSCCIGWEIDIDRETDAYYAELPGPIGEKLRANIDRKEIPHFVLGIGERCPFLDQKNLCELISQLGEDALCQICRDHPRFHNEFTNRTEMGLGLCCEAACDLILWQEEPARLTCEEPDENAPEEERLFFTLRSKVFTILQDRSTPMEQRLSRLLTLFHKKLPDLDWQTVFYNLERLDPTWEDHLQALRFPAQLPADWDLPLEQIAVYFIYRHLAGALEDGRYGERCAFAALSVQMIAGIAKSKNDLPEIARLYSSEIEYSDENTNALLNLL